MTGVAAGNMAGAAEMYDRYASYIRYEGQVGVGIALRKEPLDDVRERSRAPSSSAPASSTGGVHGNPEIKALTFDVFGTVVDWRSSLIPRRRGARQGEGAQCRLGQVRRLMGAGSTSRR